MTLTFRVEEVAEIDSTNEACRQRALQGEQAGLVIRADLQTKGRGRRGRDWVSPKGNLYTSILLQPARPAGEIATLGFVAVLALGDAVQAILPPTTQVSHKWPNDLLLNGRKASGILLETQTAQGASPFVILGIGVNIVSHPADTPYPVTDLLANGAALISPRELLDRLLAAFAAAYASWEQGGFAAIEPAWRRRAIGIGQPIEVRLQSGSLRGTFRDLDSDGALRLALPEGGERRISAGDVYFPNSSGA
jgi:BirA family transcriptional regulator, biotin operon repressor / biotin---[acetyl-CoA-carboxylase] ligase